ncbi:SH3 domain-containing protein 21 isoform X2 [Plectropomus leopardus]|uniref:SH3 domain-containing protein 21 isoform X2 n=1 Tax=Plectropomus leopardus TaxID=160734 RepID=UPI001C4B0BDB|nr:SH3 domain-containing protein 21 isoform X2 [Plectropomus leopardus]
MEVLVLIDFEGTMGDELTVRTGDVVKNVTKASEDGWLEGELRGKRGIFPANFVKEVPVYLIGDSKREPRSIRKTKRMKQTRKCEVAYTYSPVNEDELSLDVGETIEIIREIEDGWWMGVKNGKVGAFPSNFVKEIFVSPKDGKHSEGKARPKLSDAVFNKEIAQRTSVRNKARNVAECCQVMFDYKAKASDELDLKKGDVVVILNKETEDEGWYEGELNGRCGFFPDNFVMLIPPMDSLQSGTASQPPARNINKKLSVKTDTSAMEKGPAKTTKDDKPESKDLRSNPPTKVKLPTLHKPSPPPVKDKPNKVLPKTNGDVVPVTPKHPEEKETNQFDGVDVQTEKLCHPTANRAKPPQRRLPSGLVTAAQAQGATDQTEPELSPKKFQTEKLPGLQKSSENLLPSPAKPDPRPKTPPPVRPAPPKLVVDGRTASHKGEVTVESLHDEIKELRMALELLQTRHDQDMQEVKEELREERNKRVALQEEVQSLKMKH